MDITIQDGAANNMSLPANEKKQNARQKQHTTHDKIIRTRG